MDLGRAVVVAVALLLLIIPVLPVDSFGHSANNRSSKEVDTAQAKPKPSYAEEPPSPSWFQLDPQQLQIASCSPQTWNVTRKLASSLSLFFRLLDTPGGHLIVSALNRLFAQELDGSAPHGLTTDPIPGQGLKIEFRPSQDSPTKVQATGKVPRLVLEAVGVQWKAVVKERSTRTKSLTMSNAACLVNAQDRKYHHSRAVLRINKARVTCTGWLWGNQGRVAMNHHCLFNQKTVNVAEFHFGYETKSRSDAKCTGPCGALLKGKRGAVKFIASDPIKYYAVVQVIENPSYYVSKYGYLCIRNGQARQGETIYVPQLPYGWPKVNSATSENDDTSPATITKTNSTIYLIDQVARTDVLKFSADAKSGALAHL